MRRLILAAVILALSLSLFAAESPLSGTWKLNPAKSKLPTPAPPSDIATVTVDDNGIKFSEEVADDKPLKIHTEAKFDGKDYPVTGDPASDFISYRRVNARTLITTTKKGGKVAQKATIFVSKDGKVTTVNFIDYSQGRPVKGMAVWDKQ